jgi:hypothetical protein
VNLTRIVPSHTKTVEFYAITTDFSHYTEGWRLARAKMRDPLDKCGWCGKPFAEGDVISLGFSHTKKNMVLCQQCAADASAGGGK